MHNNGPINHQNGNIKVPMNYNMNPGSAPIQNGIYFNPVSSVSSVPPMMPITPITSVAPLSAGTHNGPYEKIQIMP